MGMVMMVAMGQQSHYKDTLKKKPLFVKFARCLKAADEILPGKGSYECAALTVQIPGLSQTRATPGISDRNSRHRVNDSSKRRIKCHFVATSVIVFAERASLHSGKLSGAKQRDSVAFVIHDHFHRGDDDLAHVIKQFTAHLAGKVHKRSALLWSRLLVN